MTSSTATAVASRVSQSYTLAAVNDAPTGTPSAVLPAGTEDTAYTVSAADLLAGFADVDLDTLAVANLAASNGTVVDNLNGTFTVTPTLNFNGPVTLTYDVIDGHGGSVLGVTELHPGRSQRCPDRHAIDGSGQRHRGHRLHRQRRRSAGRLRRCRSRHPRRRQPHRIQRQRRRQPQRHLHRHTHPQLQRTGDPHLRRHRRPRR